MDFWGFVVLTMVPTQGVCWFTQGGKEMDPSLTEVKEFQKKEPKNT